MSKISIDVRGLACPEPLIAFTGAAKDPAVTEMEISFDCPAARDNISRAARSLGWAVRAVEESADHTVMQLEKTT
jgi:TusA-related sulfurtransferase